jgi:hypothetical protein
MIKIISNKEYERIIAQMTKIDLLQQHIDHVEKEYAKTINNPSINDKDRERLVDLEVKMAKLWALLLETTPRNKDKLTRIGKMYSHRI